jgi:hypothetical protein
MKKTLLIMCVAIALSTLQGYGQSSLRTKAKMFIKKLHCNYDYPMGGCDTLIDLNRDSYKDILIEYYGMSGIKNRIDIIPTTQ